MRVLFALALIALGLSALGLAGVTAASAGNARGYSVIGGRAAPLVIYDYQPGVVVRAYWLAPWRHRHYYPTTGEKPEVGRDEDLSTGASGAPEPAETFQRSWSTSAAFRPELLRAEPLPQVPDAVKP